MSLAAAAVRANPSDAAAWDLIADCRAVGGPAGIVLRPFIGLTSGAVHDPQGEAAARTTAVEALPSPRRWSRLGTALAMLGDQRAEDAFAAACALDAPSDTWYERGRYAATVAARRGGYDRALFEQHSMCMRRALESDSRHHRARYHLVRVAIRAQAWETALEGAVPRSEPIHAQLRDLLIDPPDDVVGTVDNIIGHAPRPVAPDLWLLVHWRLHALGRMQEGFMAKDRFAAELLVASPHRRGSLHATMQTAQALACLNRSEDAIEHVRRALRTPLPRYERATLEKLVGDLHLACGTASEEYYGQLRWCPVTPAERRFRDLIANASVAVVGPSVTEDRVGAEIDEFDVVVRPKFVLSSRLDPATQGSRTDIAYFNASAATLLGDEIRTTLDSGGLRLAVLRPETWLDGGATSRAPDVRYSPSETTSLLESSHFAVQRILYDILRYRPKLIKVFNVDFYTSPARYHATYNVDWPRFADHGILRNLDGYGHDLRADHRFARRLLEAGMIHADRTAVRVLQLPERDYVSTVEAAYHLLASTT